MMYSFLENSTDIHIHCCPHINKRSTDIFEVVKFAEKNKMYAIGLMDNFSNTSGYASLVKKKFPNLNLKIFGGLIMEPPAGGVNYENAKIFRVIQIHDGSTNVHQQLSNTLSTSIL